MDPPNQDKKWPEFNSGQTFLNYNNLGQYITLKTCLILVLVFILLFFLFSSLGSFLGGNASANDFLSADPSASALYEPGSSSSGSTSIGAWILIGILVIVLVGFAMEMLGYGFFSSSSSSSTKPTGILPNLFATSAPDNDTQLTPKSDAYTDIANQSSPESSTVQEIVRAKQVFNIPGNNYNYDNAKALCAAYGARLATLSEVENSYKKGGEWCNYGWSDGQMALYPTQQKTYDKYQTIPGHEHDCGRPGVNGGYMENKELTFGVNCYGYKPQINGNESYTMQYDSPFPKSEEEKASQANVNNWKNRINDILVSPFNHESWSEV